MTSYSDAILEDWRRWLYMDGFLRARELDHPALVTNMMGTLRWFVDHELYLQTGRFGGSKMPGMGGDGFVPKLTLSDFMDPQTGDFLP